MAERRTVQETSLSPPIDHHHAEIQRLYQCEIGQPDEGRTSRSTAQEAQAHPETNNQNRPRDHWVD